MYDIITETLYDTLKMLPFLFVAYLVIEYVEHKGSGWFHSILSHSNRFGAVMGALVGCFPQCGFSVVAANLYSGRVISLGTLAAVFLSTSDEAIPVLLSSPDSFGAIFKLIAYKLVIAIVAGLIIDLLARRFRKSAKNDEDQDAIHDMCASCDCNHGIVKAAIKHTIQIFIFLVLVSFILNVLLSMVGKETLSKILLSDNIFQPILATVLGLIPNCVSSVILTTLYIEGTISFGSIIAGLAANAGMGWLVLFKMNKNMKENFQIVGLICGIGILAGMLIQVLGIG